MSTSDTTSAPETPASSLLFQAPAFQAPAFAEPSFDGESSSRGPGRTRTEDDGDREEPAPRGRRRRRGAGSAQEDAPAPAPASDASDLDQGEPEEQEAAPKRRSRRSRRARSAEQEPASQESPAADSSSEGDSGAEPEAGQPEEEPAGSSSSAPAEEEGQGPATRRRRRRRSRSSSQDAEPEDLSDQVKALKGSTRLEAKKQRRKEGRKEGRRHHVITESEFLARRESVTREMVIRRRDGLDQIAVLEDGLLVEHYVARHTQQSAVGNIYLGRVQNVLPSMEAAFIDIGRGRNAVLYAGEVNWDAVGLEGRPRRIESALKSGEAVLVQVTKDPIGHKGARLTSQITLAGRYLVLIPHGSMMGISRKLPENERQRLKKILKKVVPGHAGVIVRTAAEGASEQQLSDDVARLTRQWEDIEKKQQSTKGAPKLLRGEPELAVRVVRDIFNEDFTELVIQGKETYQTVADYVAELSPELSDRVQLWTGTDDVFHAHRVDEQLAKGMDRKVWLPSGGTLIIDRTEAMTVIDVNTGKYIGKGGTLEETVTRNNLEAAEEIVRQLRLRDIGGIVIVDFVDMVLESNRDLVLRRLVECLGRDRTRHQVTEITSLGLVQMTRKRVGEGLVEAFSTPCEVCEGRGFIVHDHPVEHAGSEPAGESRPNRHSRKKAAEEPRRIDEGPEREKAREAMSAIAAASGHGHRDEGDAAGEGAAADGTAEPEQIQEGAAQAAGPEPEKPAPSSSSRRPRRRRAATASVVEPPVEAAPTGVQETTSGSAQAHRVTSLEEIELPDSHAEEPRASQTRRRHRRAVSSGVVDTDQG
ncbi:MAG: Rne/Rng family ribonuclease [Actinomyces sp.]|nr:Rne/Rng family ribonuclease [Actinomyces sp.]MCI1828926.1 Rne/Rng family ribonuclease [Actinomyces sp.]